MIKKIEFFRPIRYEYDSHGYPRRVCTNQQHLRFQLLIKTISEEFLIYIFATPAYCDFESELEQDFEESNEYDLEFVNPEAFDNIENYIMVFEDKQLPEHPTSSLVSMKNILEHSIEFMKTKMKHQIKKFDIEYVSEVDYDEEYYTEEMYDYDKKMKLEEILSPSINIKEKIEFCQKMLNKQIVFNQEYKSESEKRLNNLYKKYDL
ncbi:hypothetical protein [Flavobacterium gilvum]|uniref:Uncharacterized protein n=1 Tax=Flavobacterium gilvum TaxID=1492737 RepID=A0AAC9I582_9FLAO|nr:hypothetical protein [Flavobacterium gilvum]AOW09915.1 hypothetical protein EM308_10565 [Flavobacterium gilvum]KFC59630.1 hypothetical protein FEM08_16220 [Flavobacterium gilvum]